MRAIVHSPDFLKKRRLYTMLPLLVLPFLTLLFWSISKFIPVESAEQSKGGMNTSLPDAFLGDKEKNMDKLAYYKRAAEDSLRRIEMIKKDPYRQLQIEQASGHTSALQGLDGGIKKEKPVAYKGRVYTDPGEAKVYAKLKELEAALAASAEPDFQAPDEPSMERDASVEITPIPPPEIQQLQVSPDILLASGLESATGHEPDPEIRELHSLLDKIMAAQQPQNTIDQARQQSEANQKRVFPVESPKEEAAISLLETHPGQDSLSETGFYLPEFQNGFFTLDEQEQDWFQNTIPAVVHQDQTIVSGATVKLRLVSQVYIAGRLIPEGTFLYGIASVTGERLKVEITSVRLESALFPVKLSVRDMDGIEGIYVPGAISRDVGKQSLSQDIQGVNLGIIDPSLGAQAMNAGIQTAKTLLGRKTRLVQVKITAGYQVLLVDDNTKPV